MISITPYGSVGTSQNQAFSAYLETYFPDSDYLMYRRSMYVSYCYIWHGDTADALLIYDSDTSSFTVSTFEYSGFSVSDTSLVLSSVSDYGYPSYLCTQLLVSRETSVVGERIHTSTCLVAFLLLFVILYMFFQTIFKGVCKYDKK